MASSCGSAPVCVTHTNGPASSYFPSSNTNAARGAALLAAFAAATNGDSVHLAAGTFDLGTSALDQSLGGTTACVNLLGSGKYSTVITSNYRSASISYPVVRAGSYCNDRRPHHHQHRWHTPSLGSVWGAADPGHNHPFVHAVVRNVAMNGNADGIYVAETGASYEAYNLTINTTFDLVTMSDPAGTYSISDSVLELQRKLYQPHLSALRVDANASCVDHRDQRLQHPVHRHHQSARADLWLYRAKWHCAEHLWREHFDFRKHDQYRTSANQRRRAEYHSGLAVLSGEDQRNHYQRTRQRLMVGLLGAAKRRHYHHGRLPGERNHDEAHRPPWGPSAFNRRSS